jgi:hypothetical protein
VGNHDSQDSLQVRYRITVTMSTLSGDQLDEVVGNVVKWYYAMREFLIESLEAGKYPYGKVKLTLEEQYIQYRRMTANDWATLIERLYERFRGLPDASSRVAEELTRYRTRMEKLGTQVSGNDPRAFLSGGSTGGSTL